MEYGLSQQDYAKIKLKGTSVYSGAISEVGMRNYEENDILHGLFGCTNIPKCTKSINYKFWKYLRIDNGDVDTYALGVVFSLIC